MTVETCTKSKDKRVWDKRHSVFTAVSLKQTFQDICRGSTWRWQSWHLIKHWLETIYLAVIALECSAKRSYGNISRCAKVKKSCVADSSKTRRRRVQLCCTPASIKFHLKDVRLYVPSPRPHP